MISFADLVPNKTPLLHSLSVFNIMPNTMDPLLTELLPAVSQQLLSSETSYVKDAHDRLTTKEQAPGKEMLTPDEATEMIAFCLADELDQMEKKNRPFDAQRYQMLLQLLPTLPEAS